MPSGKNISKEPEEPEAILGDLHPGSSSDSDSDHVTTLIKYEEVHTGNEIHDDFESPIDSKIEISDIGVDFGDSLNDLNGSPDQRRVKVEGKVEESNGQSTGSRDLFCEDCNMSFSNKYGLKRHLNSHRRMPCPVEGCSNVSYTKNTFYIHQKTHQIKNVGSGEVLYSCTYPGCSKVYKSVDSFKRHRTKMKHGLNPKNMKKPTQLKKHPGSPLICKVCGEKYKTKYQLNIHIKNVCSKSSTYPCTFQGCNKVSKTRALLVAHLRSHTATGNRYCKCEFCGAEYRRNVALQRHRLLNHLESLPEEDREENQKKFDKLREDIRKYKKRYRAKKGKVEEVKGKRYKVEKKNGKEVNGKKKLESYPCTYQGCDKVFNGRNGLLSHLKVHRGVRLKCEFCGARFVQNVVLQRHELRYHLDSLPLEDRESNLKKLERLRKSWVNYNTKISGRVKLRDETEEERKARRGKYREMMRKYSEKKKEKKKRMRGVLIKREWEETPEERKNRLERKAAQLKRYKGNERKWRNMTRKMIKK